MTRYIILPGINGSGENHWQTRWERASTDMHRFRPTDWDHPKLADWMDALDTAVAAASDPPILVAHSLACLLVAHWAAVRSAPVAGAFLVSVPDPFGPTFPTEAADFADPPRDPLPFPSVVVTSSDDPYGGADYQTRIAADWGGWHVLLGPLGHINGASGLGDWRGGRALLEKFVKGLPTG